MGEWVGYFIHIQIFHFIFLLLFLVSISDSSYLYLALANWIFSFSHLFISLSCFLSSLASSNPRILCRIDIEYRYTKNIRNDILCFTQCCRSQSWDIFFKVYVVGVVSKKCWGVKNSCFISLGFLLAQLSFAFIFSIHFSLFFYIFSRPTNITTASGPNHTISIPIHPTNPKFAEIVISKECWRFFIFISEMMNERIPPGDEFFNFLCSLLCRRKLVWVKK